MSFEQQIVLGALVVSLLVHAGLFMHLPNRVAVSEERMPKVATQMRLNLLQVEKKSQHIVKTEISPLPAIPPKPEPQPKPKPKPKMHNKREAVQRVIKPVKSIVHEQVTAPIETQKINRQQPIEATPFKKQDYFSSLLTHIERHKNYPRSARHRRIEGSIKVSFQLQENGTINGLVTSGGPLILRRAAKLAVEQALPLPAPPADIACPLQVSYSMKFQLR